MNNAEAIITLGSHYWGISEEQLKAKTRKREVVIARQSIMVAIKEFTNNSLKSIGHYMGGRDHSTVLHSLTANQDMIDTDKEFSTRMAKFKEKVITELNIGFVTPITEDQIDKEFQHLI